MLRLMLKIQFILLTIDINAFLYRLKKIPLIRKCIPSSCYSWLRGKNVFSIFVILRKTVWSVVKKIIYIFLLLLVPCMLTDSFYGDTFTVVNIEAMFCYYFLFINIIYGALLCPSSIENKEQDYIMVKQMRVKAKPYYLVSFIGRSIWQSLAMAPGMFIFSAGYLHLSESHIIMLILLLICFRFLGQALWIYAVENDIRWYVDEISLLSIASLILILPFTYGTGMLVKGNQVVLTVLFHPFTISIAVILGLAAIYYIIRYQGYSRIAAKQIQFTDAKAMLEDDVEQIEQDSLKIEDTKLDENEVKNGKFSHLKGYEYLNAIFFERHKKELQALFRCKLFAICAATFIFMVVVIEARVMGRSIWANKNWNTFAPALVFILYLVCSGEDVCKTLFYHCDRFLLKYGYYRESKTLLTNFRIRLRYLILLDLVPTIVLILGLSLCMLSTGGITALVDSIPLLVLIPCTSIFYDVYQLFLYYVFQPYLENYTKAGIGYSIWSRLIYLFAIWGPRGESVTIVYTKAALVTVVLCIPISYALIYWLAPKRFKLR